MPGAARGRLVIRASLRGAGRLAGAFLLAAGAILSVSPAFAQPAAPTGFEVAQAGSIKAKLAWNAPAAGAGIVRHEVRFRAGSAAFPDMWTAIPSSRPGQANAAGYLLSGLTAETDYDFELRAVSGDGDGTAASASATTLPPFTASFSPLKTYYEGTLVTMTIVFTAAIDKPTLEKGVLVHGGNLAVRASPGQPETWHISATSTRGRDVTFFLFAARNCDTLGFNNLCSTLGEPLTAALTAEVPHVPSVTLALSLATISEDSGMTTVTASLNKKWHEDVTVAVSAAPVAPATSSDFNLSSTTTLTIAADDRTSTGAVTVTAVDNDAQAANKEVTVSGEVTAPDYVPEPDAVALTIRDDDAAAPAPTGFAVSVGSTTAELSWDPTPKGVTVTAHEVRYRAGADAFPATWTAIPDSAPGEANATGHTVTALSPGTDYDFELRVVNDNGSSSAATASATTQAAFTARFVTLRDTHDRTPFAVRIGFSAAIASTGVLEQGVQLTGGDNTDVTAVGGDDDLFDYEVTPSGVGAVTITLPVASGCGSNGAICNTFDEPLSAELTGTVAFFGVPPSGKLVGNVTKSLDTGTLPTNPATSFVYAQSFTTGANETGYKLDRIGIHLTQVDPGDLAAVSLLSADADGEPDAELYPLTGPLALQTGAMNYFSAPPGALLTKETTYYLQVTGAGRSEFRVRIVGGTDETEEDADSAADWLVGDNLRERTSTTEWITTPKVMKIRVDGRVLGTFPTVFLGLAPPAVAESGAATVTAAALPASDTAFTVTVSASPVSPATASDFSLSANATLDFVANETASTGTVTITAADDTAETADREVTVSGSVSATGIAGPEDVTLTILDDDAEPFTAEFSEIPETHDGQTAFTVKIRFSADIASSRTLADGVELTGGTAGSITRVGSGADHWNYPVTPAGDDDVYIALPVPSGCTGTGDICSADDVRLATALVGRVAGPVSQDLPDGGDPPEDGAPAAPTGFAADDLDAAVRLLWRAPLADGGSEITHHEYRQRIDDPDDNDWLAWSDWKTIPDSTPGGQNGESFTVTDLENGRWYQFELRAVNAIGSTGSQPQQVAGFPGAAELPIDLSLKPSPPDPAPAVFSRAEYTVKFTGAWTLAVTPDGLPSDAHFSRLVGGVHNGDVVFLTDTGPASPGVESMAEEGNTTLLKAEIKDAGDDRLSVLEGTKVTIDPTASESFTEVALTTDHPRVTLVTMIAPTPDWFVGVSGLSMLDSLGGWRASRMVYLHPFDAGTEDGAAFSLSNDPTDPPEYITSLVGKGKFSAEPIATLTFTRTSVASAPAAPADLAATPGDASVALAWTTGADGGSAIRMHQYRYRTGAAYPAAWTDIPDSAAGGANVSGFTVDGLTNGASHSFQVRARNDIGAGPAATSGAATPMPTVVVNAAPTFDSAATFSAAENQTVAGTVEASDSDTGDNITGYALTGGADQGAFSIGATSGELTFNAAPNYEAPSDTGANNTYVVEVRATSGTGTRVRTATQTITVTVTDVSGEAPGKPAAPSVSAASVTSLNVNWSAPANAGPAITDYDVQYRAGTSGAWSVWTHNGAATATTITGLAEDTSHQVQVRATNDEGTGGWSASGSGSTFANAPPAFDSPAAFSIAENLTEIGMVRASDSDTGDNVTGYEITGGADQSFFSIGATSGALAFDAAPNFEDAKDIASVDPANAAGNNQYVVVVTASSGTDERVKTATQTITVTVTDVNTEAPGKPAAPNVSAASATSLSVSWTAPANDGPAITDYDHRHRTSPAGSWTEVTGTTSTALSATIAGLADGTSYDVQVRATNDEGTGDWSDSGTESTAANAAPTFDSSATFSAAENQTTAGTVEASDSDTGDNVTGYEITGGADRAFFSIGATSGALTFDAAPNFEDAKDIASVDPANAAGNNQYVVVVTASSGADERVKTATQTITVTVTDVNTEAPGKPAAPNVSAASATSLSVSWTAPANDGPAITDYDHRHRTSPAGSWTEVTGTTSTALSATIAGLADGTSYDVQVRATNDEGTGDWSDSGTESTAANAAPTFDSSATFSAAENQTTAGTVEASDSDTGDNVTGYEITGGADRAFFSIGATSGALTFDAAPNFEDAKDIVSVDPANAAGNNQYVVVVTATSGAVEREKTATQTITVTVTDAGGEAPGKPAAPTVTAASATSLTVTWSAPANDGPAITDYDYRHRTSPDGSWTEVTDTAITALSATITGLADGTSYDVQVRATNDEGTGDWSDSGTESTDANAAPSFDSSATFSAAENQTVAGTVRASDSDTGDDITGYEITGGADQGFFSIGATSGALTFDAAPNFEDAKDIVSVDPANAAGNNQYVVVVTATSGAVEREKTATQTITVTVTDAGGEAPGKPAAPTVTAASATSLTVTWSAPANDGPAITDYDYRHRTSPDGSWTEVTDTAITALSATITGLADGTSYDVQVRATNDEGTGDWSDSGTESTDANAAPSFDSSATFSAAENQTVAGTVRASDSDTGDDITGYEITGGADQGFFSIGATSGALTFDAAPNFEDAKDIVSVDPANAAGNNQYVVVVTATSGAVEREKTATQTITVTVTDVSGEAPGKPAAPTVTAASATSLTVTWSAPANDGPAITDYDYRHRTSPDGSWTEVTDTAITALSATITGLADGTSYDVQVRATNDEGTGDWSDSGTESTDANAAPSFDSSATFSAAENQTVAGTVRASDSDTGDDITGYEITGGADQGFFSIGATSGALTFDAAPNFEDAKDIVSVDPANAAGNNQYVVVVTATSGAVEREKTATQTITVTVTDVSGEAPGKPAAPNVSAASATSLNVSWSAPANAGPAITDYDHRHRTTSPEGSWTAVADTTSTALSATITGLADGTSYDVQVRATNDEGTGAWSDSGSGTTDANAAPSFSSSATFDAAENQTTAGTVLATDSDTGDDVTGYEITGGADQTFFSIGATDGALTFKTAPNYEDAKDIESVDPANAAGNNQYVVVVTATSGAVEREKTATQTITVTVTDVGGEAPGKPAAPNVSAASATSLNVSWSAPANAGPAITDYDHRHRTTSPEGSWTAVADTTSTALSATITGLADGTSYDVQVRATNDEGTGAWSDSGSGTTDANAAPSFSSSATFDAAENQTTAGTVLATDSDTGDDVTGYEITGGADQTFFSIGATDGALTFKTAPNYEDAKDIESVDPANAAGNNQYVVVVTATSGAVEREKTATQTITVTVTDVGGEAPGKPAAPNVSAASATSLNVNWSAPDNAGPAITDYDHRHRTASPEGNWTEVTGATSTALSATIAGLAEGTSYDVQVRATNDEGTGDWSDSGTESTDANAAPSFDSPSTFNAAENQTTAGTVEASDSDTGDDITGYALTGGADQTFFSIGVTSGALTFDAAPNFEDAKDQNTNNQYVVEVEATSGTGTREKTATQTITVTVTDVDTEAPGKPAAPNVSAASATNLSVSWSAPANAGPAIIDYDHRHRTSRDGSWTEVTGTTSTALSATITGLADGTSYDVQVRATNDEGTGDWSDSGTGSTDANAAPAFSSSATFDAAENQTTAGTVEASDSDTDDDITGYEITGGADRAFFSVGATSGELTFDAAPNFEAPSDTGANNTYVVEVQASSGAGERVKTATQTITVTVTDVNTEAPGKPAAPNVSAASATNLSVSWSAPANAGPAIIDYDHRHRTSPDGSWTEVTGTASTALSATITGLADGTAYDVQVRATNDEGTGDWSDSGTGSTDANAAPAFSSDAAFDAAENQTTAGAVLATDSDAGDDITAYDITGGADQAFFSIGATDGALTFKSAPNFEDAKDIESVDPANAAGNNQYVVEVRATSGAGEREKTATQTITVTVTDVAGEAPGKPAAPNVSAASATSLTVSWSAPANAGPAITDYDVQYREGTSGGWTDGNYTGTVTTATLSGLSENTTHQVQVRATNDEGTGSWSDSGSGATDANAAPAFSSDAAFDAAENQTAAGTVVASDGDSEDKIERYDITGGADQALFMVIASSGDLEFRDAPNFEDAQDQDTNNQYVVTVQATSGTGTREKTATQTITVTVTDVAGEAPGKPDAPNVSAASASSLSVTWSAPANAGPAITDYDVQYREGTSGSWSDGGHAGAATTATLSGLSENTSYQVQVQATNDEGTGSWSDSGTGTTDANAAPAFSSSAAFDAAENQTSAGMVLAADSDSEDDVTGYALTGGADQSFFSIGTTSGALTFDDAPNFEDAEDQGTDNTYVVEVRATSGTDSRVKTATQTITVTVTDVSGEAPGKPDAPNVSAASVTSLTVSWSAPDNAGPAITDYDYRHRTTSPVGNWTEVTDTTSTALSATIGSLAETTSYDLQVRATNAEGTGDWSASGTGSTDANAAPAFDSAATFTPAENQTTVGTVVASDGDTEDDIEDYAITGGADQGKFSIHATSGALTFKAAPNYEDPDDADADGRYLVTVQATSGTRTREKTATADIRVTLQNVIELFTQLTGPSSTDYAENGAVRVATYIASSEADRDGIAWNLGGDEVEHFSIDNPAGVLRFDIDPVDPSPFPQPPDFEAPVDDDDDGVYELIVLAQAGSDLTLKTVIVTVTDENEAGAISLDTARPKMGDPPTATLTDPDGVTAGTVTWQWERSAGRNAWVVIDGAAAASYTPTAADTGAYLRVTATYTDSHAADQTAQAVSAEVVTAELLGSLAVTTNASTANPDRWAMRPEFSADILHYAVGCTATDPGDTMTLAFAAANAGTRVAVNGEQADDRKATVEVPVEGDSEVRITLATGSTGVHTTYVVHCMDSRNPAIERTIKEPGASTELITVYAQIGSSRHDISATYLAIIDANGVPRWQRRLNTRATHFKAHPDGKYPYSYGHYRPSTYSYRMVILDENLDEVERVTTTGALQHTGAHDFAIRENGNYVFEAYEPATRDFSAYTDEDDNPYGTSEATEDSVIEEVNPAGDRVFFWNSWDHMYLNDCLQHRFPIDYAHINSVQVVDEADIIASFRGCSQVWRIDRETETGEWLLGRSNRSDAEWEARGIQRLKIVGDPEGEFCGQHSARLIPNGHLLLFDNDHHCLEDPETGDTQRPNLEFSRVVEYALDLDNGEAVFVRQHCLGNICDRISASQGHIHRMDSGHWLVSWGRGPSYNFPDASVTEVDPLTNEELLAFKITHPGYNAGADVAQPTRAYPVEFVALADTPGPLTAEIVESPASSLFHLGPTDAPKVVVAFNRPVVDPDPAATTWPWVSVQGATVTSVSAHTVPGDPANAYLFTLTPAGVGPITFALVAGQSCASGGICTAAGTVLSAVPATAHTIAWVDTVAPALAATDAATVRGATLTLTFDEALATANTAASAFAVTGGTTRTISGVSVNGSAVQLTIDPPILYGESGIEVDYTTPSREALADASGNKVASFEDRAVSNETPATTLSTEVSLSLDTPSVSEGGSAKSVALTAMLNRSARPAATAVTVEVGTTGDTATEGTDYAAVDDLTLTIPAYMTGITVRFTLTPMNDRIDESGESLTVTGSTAVAGLIVTPPGGLALDIEDNDPAPSLALSVNASAIDEDGGTAAVTVSTGSGSTYATDQTVRLAVAGTATENADYTIGGKALTLPAGTGTSASMVTATVTGLDDNLDDDDETIEITGSRNGVAFGSRQTIAIEDDDWPVLTVTFRQADYRVAEGGHVDLPVTLSAVPERQVTIPIEIEVAGGAEAVDYSVSPASLTFGASETDKTLRVSASNDGAVDPGEGVTLSFGTTLPERISEGGIAETTVAIRDTDFTFAPAFAAGSGTTESDTDVYAVSEASRALRLSLRLETPRGARVVDIADPVVVSLATRENAGSRETDEDYATQRRSGTFGDYGQYSRDLSFAPADFSDDAACGCARARKAVSVDIFDDRLRERVEVFGLRLSRKSRRLSVPSKDITAKIADDDAEPALTLDANPARIAEAGGTSTVTVSTGGGSTFAAAQTIRLDLSGTATRGSDYTIDSTALTLPAGMGENPSTVTTTVRALDDPFDDDAETVALSATRDGVEFAGRTIAIADDDIGSTRVDLAVNPAQVREDAGATTVRVTATLDGAARAEDTDVAVTVGASGDSAVEGTDYATVPDLTLTIDAGETTAETTFRLAPANDSAVEGARTITVDGSALGLAVRSADLTLNDDDVESTTVTLTLDPLEVRENAGSRAVRVTGTLDGGSRPTATVVAVTVGSGGDSAAEGEDYAEIPELELTIPANRTDGTVTFALRPTNDRTAEGTETISVRGDVAGLTVTPAELAIADDDTASTRLDLSLNPSTVSEAAAPTEVAVTASLNAGARTSDSLVTVTVGAFTDTATQDLDYANVSTLRITVPANETAGQTMFTLSPDNDAIAEGAETITVTGRVRGLSVEPAALTLSDNDTASRVVTLSVDPESVSEDTPEDVTVTASLNAGARAEDTAVRLTVGAAGDTAVPGTDYERVSERTLTILSGETGGTATFLLEPLDNDSADGARTLSVTGSTTVAELRIEPASGAKVALEDDDNPAVLVTPDTLTVVEAESDTYAVALQTRPTADVTVTITGVSGDLSLDKTSLVFTGADWSDPQDVEVTAADDDDSARDPDVTLTHRASGAPEYRGLRTELVVTIRENDPSLVFSATSVTVPEGETATYTVALATEPTAEVTVRIAGASGDLSLDKTRLAFTPGDWDDAQTITVEAAEDDDTSTDAAVTLTHEASGGGYDGVVGTVRATIREDDGDPRPPPPPPPGPGPGPSPPPSNRPPVATEEMTARILEVGDTLELDASEHFRDPDRRRMTFEAESADSAVATVEVDGGAVTVRAADHGAAAVTVTAVDDRRARATQSFEVTVGRLVSFASEEVAAAEGDTATLTVAISRPRDAATALDYVVGPDDDPATADADADDHDGMAGTVVIAAGATQATIAIAVRDDDDIEPPRETFAVTLRRSAEQARDFGLGVAAVRVRIDEGVCDRTPQVRDALRRTLPCARVSESDLAGVRTLDLSNAGLAALRPADFSGLRNLRALDVSGNSLASLPDGVFAGLGELSEVQSQDNPGSPFVLRVELARTDGPASAPSPARLATRVRQGAPFPLRAGLKAVGGALSSDASVVATGMTESAPISVVRTSAGATRVELVSAPSVPDTRCGRFGRYSCYRGFATAIGAPLVLFKDPPEVRGSVPATDLAAENDSIRISLSDLFVAVDGRPLRYAARSSDPGLAGAEVRGGVLIVVSGEDGREGTATITVTATDADGLSAELTFEVTLESMPRGFMRGWRRALIEGILE